MASAIASMMDRMREDSIAPGSRNSLQQPPLPEQAVGTSQDVDHSPYYWHADRYDAYTPHTGPDANSFHDTRRHDSAYQPQPCRAHWRGLMAGQSQPYLSEAESSYISQRDVVRWSDQSRHDPAHPVQLSAHTRDLPSEDSADVSAEDLYIMLTEMGVLPSYRTITDTSSSHSRDSSISSACDPNYNNSQVPLPKAHECPQCLKRFPRPSSLKVHMNVHTKEKPFQCTYDGCDKRFTVASNAKRHLKTHGVITDPQPILPEPYVVDFADPVVFPAEERQASLGNGKPATLYWVNRGPSGRSIESPHVAQSGFHPSSNAQSRWQ